MIYTVRIFLFVQLRNKHQNHNGLFRLEAYQVVRLQNAYKPHKTQ